MNVLQVIWDGGGNTAPQLAIARELVARGHDVRVVGHRRQRDAVEAAGAGFVAFRHAPDSDASRPETDLLRDWEARTPIGGLARVRDRLMFGPCERFARDVLETLEARPADAIAWDYLLAGAGIAAEHARVPHAAIVHTIYPLPSQGAPPFGPGLMPARGRLGRARDALLTRLLVRAFAPGVKVADAVRADLGLPALDGPFDQIARADRVIVLTAAGFDFAARGALPPNVRYAGPVAPRDGARATWEPPGEPGDTRPLVLASFSTTFMDQHELAARTVRALAKLPVRALLTTGPAIDAARLPAAPNVDVREFLPHAAVLPHAALAITHAGMGTVHAALTAGVPLVCIPHGRDQDDVAARVVFHRAGVRVRPGVGEERLRRVVASALADPALAQGAQRLAGALRGLDGAAAAADEIESLVA